ncbi:MAG: hypothetical protein ACTSSA_15100 [Candidatus Freyarchaeota archaeon]
MLGLAVEKKLFGFFPNLDPYERDETKYSYTTPAEFDPPEKGCLCGSKPTSETNRRPHIP